LPSFQTLPKIKSQLDGYKTCKYSPNGKLWYGAYNSAGYIEDNKLKVVLKKRTYALLPLRNKRTWLGTVEGLYFCNDTNCDKIDIELLQQDIRDIQIDKDDVLWLATQSNGVVLYKDQVLRHITTKDGLAGDNCVQIFLDNQYAWIATTLGISKINLTDFSIQNITTADGLPYPSSPFKLIMKIPYFKKIIHYHILQILLKSNSIVVLLNILVD